MTSCRHFKTQNRDCFFNIMTNKTPRDFTLTDDCPLKRKTELHKISCFKISLAPHADANFTNTTDTLTLFIRLWGDLAPPSDADVCATLAWPFRIHTWFMKMWFSPAVFPPQSLPAAVIAVLLSSYQNGSARESEKITGKWFKTQWHRRNGE